MGEWLEPKRWKLQWAKPRFYHCTPAWETEPDPPLYSYNNPMRQVPLTQFCMYRKLKVHREWSKVSVISFHSWFCSLYKFVCLCLYFFLPTKQVTLGYLHRNLSGSCLVRGPEKCLHWAGVCDRVQPWEKHVGHGKQKLNMLSEQEFWN